MASLADVYRVINEMKTEGIVEEYAIGGAMAALFYAETTPTFDVDVFVSIPQTGLLVDLSGIYNWARSRNYEVRDEYLMIHGLPVQVLAANPGLETEAIESANLLTYNGIAVRVMKPEYLIALYTQTGGSKRHGRAHDLFAEDALDPHRLKEILQRFDLTPLWFKNGGQPL